MSNTNKATLTANGLMDTKDGIQDVTRAALQMVETDLNYLRDEGVDGPRYEVIMQRVADRLAVQSARIRLAIGYGGET